MNYDVDRTADSPIRSESSRTEPDEPDEYDLKTNQAAYIMQLAKSYVCETAAKYQKYPKHQLPKGLQLRILLVIFCFVFVFDWVGDRLGVSAKQKRKQSIAKLQINTKNKERQASKQATTQPEVKLSLLPIKLLRSTEKENYKSSNQQTNIRINIEIYAIVESQIPSIVSMFQNCI